jgi:hypothetical protein
VLFLASSLFEIRALFCFESSEPNHFRRTQPYTNPMIRDNKQFMKSFWFIGINERPLIYCIDHRLVK